MSASTINLGGITCMAEAPVEVVARAIGETLDLNEADMAPPMCASAVLTALDDAGYAVVPKERVGELERKLSMWTELEIP